MSNFKKVLIILSTNLVFFIPSLKPAQAQVDVQMIDSNALENLQTCNQIMNLASADPNNLELGIQARNCSLLLYQYQLCLVQESSAVPPDPNLAAKCTNMHFENIN